VSCHHVNWVHANELKPRRATDLGASITERPSVVANAVPDLVQRVGFMISSLRLSDERIGLRTIRHTDDTRVSVTACHGPLCIAHRRAQSTATVTRGLALVTESKFHLH
jgi:hypothetical protein